MPLLHPLLLYGITSWALTYSSNLMLFWHCKINLLKSFILVISIIAHAPFLFPETHQKYMNYINCSLYHLFMKAVCSKIHVNFIIISAVFQIDTPMQQGNPVTKNSSSHVKTRLSMAYFQSVMLELLSGSVFPRISEADHLFIVSVKP